MPNTLRFYLNDRYPLANYALWGMLLWGMLLSGCTVPLVFPTRLNSDDLRQSALFTPPDYLSAPPQTLEDQPPVLASKVVDEARASLERAADAQSLDLTDALTAALANNLGLKVEVFREPQAEQQLLAEQAKFEAILGATTSLSGRWDGRNDGTRSFALTPNVTLPLTTGGRIALELPYSYSDSDERLPGFDPTQPAPRLGETVNIGFNVSGSQPLLRNAGIEVNTASIRVAALQARQTEARTKLFAIRLLANTEQAYWRYFAARELLRIQLRQYDLFLEQVRNTQRQVEEGIRIKVDISRAQAAVARNFDGVIRAELNRRRAERALKRLLNRDDLPISGNTVILPTTMPQPLGLSFDRERVAQLAQQNRMELFENELQAQIDQLNYAVADNATLPDVRFDFRYGFAGAKDNFGDAFEQLFNRALNSYQVGLTLEVPLEGNRAARARRRSALLQAWQTRAFENDLRQSVRLEVENAVDTVEENWQRILTNRISIERAQEAYEDELLQFQGGFNTSNDVLNALTELTDAQSSQIQALTDFQNALVDVAFATGTTLGKSGVIWTPAALPVEALPKIEEDLP